jgi:soluble lytic murein transglycosylase
MSPRGLSCLLVWLWLLAPGRPASPAEELGRAAALYRQGDFAACQTRAEALPARTLRNPDVRLWLLAQCRLYAGRPAEALEALEAIRPDSPLRELAAARRADCLWALGRQAEAVAAYAAADGSGQDPRVDAAVGLARRAEYAQAAGRPEEARALWLVLRRRFPDHPLTGPAPPGQPEPRLAAREGLALARGLQAARRWQDALRVLDLVPDPGTPAGRWEVAFLAGRILFDMRGRYARAAALLGAARARAATPAQREEAWFWTSRALSRADLDQEAIRSHLKMAAEFPGGRFTDQALFYAGWLAQNEGQCARALPVLARVLAEHPRSRHAEDARWFQAWCHLQAGAWEAALASLDATRRDPRWQVGGRALYWSGVAQAARGRPHEARAAFLRLTERHPLTWYALLARAWLGAETPAPAPAPAPAPTPAVQDELLDRADELSKAGLGALASDLLRREERAFLARHPGRTGLLGLLEAYARAGDQHRPWALSGRREGAALSALPDPQTRALWSHAYPECQREPLLERAGGDAERARFLQAIMRTESGFDPLARSTADARGLMQMIPPTAQRAAEALGLEDYHPARLFEPEVNLAVAGFHLAELELKFRRQWPLVAAAYNGGVPAVTRWLDRTRFQSLDWFVEAIPYAETRAYAKAVLTAMARYAHLEGAPPPELELAFDPRYLPGGPPE